MVIFGPRLRRIDIRQKPTASDAPPARIDTGQGSRLLHCVIDDLWESGAHITLAIDTKLPSEFVLVLSAEGDARRRCRTLWRDHLELSVEFLTDPREGSLTTAQPGR
jgi:hypothetical protein